MRSPSSASATSRDRTPAGGNQQRLDFPFRDAVDQRGAVRKLSDFSQELARALLRHWRYVADAVALGYRDVAGEHDVHTWIGFAGFDQFFAVGVAMQRAEAAQPIDFLRRQDREGFVIARRHRPWRGLVCLGFLRCHGSSRAGVQHRAPMRSDS